MAHLCDRELRVQGIVLSNVSDRSLQLAPGDALPRKGFQVLLKAMPCYAVLCPPVEVDLSVTLSASHLQRVMFRRLFSASPARHDKRVVFPQPEGPSTASGLEERL